MTATGVADGPCVAEIKARGNAAFRARNFDAAASAYASAIARIDRESTGDGGCGDGRDKTGAAGTDLSPRDSLRMVLGRNLCKALLQSGRWGAAYGQATSRLIKHGTYDDGVLMVTCLEHVGASPECLAPMYAQLDASLDRRGAGDASPGTWAARAAAYARRFVPPASSADRAHTELFYQPRPFLFGPVPTTTLVDHCNQKLRHSSIAVHEVRSGVAAGRGVGVFATQPMEPGQPFMMERPEVVFVAAKDRCACCTDVVSGPMLPCSRCTFASYCGAACRAKDADAHWPLCGADPQAAAANELVRACLVLAARLIDRPKDAGLGKQPLRWRGGGAWFEAPDMFVQHALRHVASAPKDDPTGRWSLTVQMRVRLAVVHAMAGVYAGADSAIDYLLTEALVAVWATYATGDDHLSVIFAASGLLNHSCVPNVDYVRNSKRCDIIYRTIGRVAAGEQLLQSYVDTGATLEARRGALSHRRFTCACARCVSEAASAAAATAAGQSAASVSTNPAPLCPAPSTLASTTTSPIAATVDTLNT